jgi:hypothetical protein
LLSTLERAVVVLNTASCFRVPSGHIQTDEHTAATAELAGGRLLLYIGCHRGGCARKQRRYLAFTEGSVRLYPLKKS